MSIAGVYPVTRLRGWMEVIRGRGPDEIFRLPGARIKLRVAIGFLAQAGALGLSKDPYALDWKQSKEKDLPETVIG